jgi:formyltetrahydrofolate hydrolase
MSDIKLFEDSRQLLDKVSQYIETARTNISTSVNFEMVKAYWLIGREIVEEEQQGSQRAEYGAAIIKELPKKLTIKYGNGFRACQI